MGKRKSECTPEEWQRQQEMQRIRYKRWLDKNPTGQRDASRRYRINHPGYAWPAKRGIGLEVRKYKEDNPCIDCGQKFHYSAMDFDHLGTNKINNIGTMVAHGWNRDKIMAEIAKCELVCANCHRIRTWKRKQNGNSASILAQDSQT